MPKTFTDVKDVPVWTTGLTEHPEVYHSNGHQFEITEVINLSPELVRDIQKVRGSLKHVEFYDDKDIFRT